MTTTTALCTQLGAQLRAARLLAELTQEQAADLAGVNHRRWSQMERGGVANINKLQAACAAIGAELTVIVSAPTE